MPFDPKNVNFSTHHDAKQTHKSGHNGKNGHGKDHVSENDEFFSWDDHIKGDGKGCGGPLCFAAGTLIVTRRGEKRIETLCAGDEVLTKDGGFRRIRWITYTSYDGAYMAHHPEHRPIRIRQGALGHGLPFRDLKVSPKHRILVRSKVAERMFGQKEVLVPAEALVGMKGIDVAEAPLGVDYYHLLLDEHSIVFAEGAEAETLYTGPVALRSLSDEARAELASACPELVRDRQPSQTRFCRPMIGRRRSVKLMERMLKNGHEPVESGIDAYA